MELGVSKLTIVNTANVADIPIALSGSPQSGDRTAVSRRCHAGRHQRAPSRTSSAPRNLLARLFVRNRDCDWIVASRLAVQAGSDGSWNIMSRRAPWLTAITQITASRGRPVRSDHDRRSGQDHVQPRHRYGRPGDRRIFFNRLNGEVDYHHPGSVERAGPSGVWVNTLLDSANYQFTKVHANKAYPGKWIVTNIAVTTERPSPDRMTSR